MHRWSTKDHYEREEAETERLVRPAPKDKPPRRDLRRERVEPEKDADSGDESDRKDRSKNYKVIGGSDHIASKDKVPATNRETGKTVYVSPETLREEPGKYQVFDEEAKEGPEKPRGSNEDQEFGARGDALLQLAKTDPKLKSKLKDFSNPESHLYGFLKENPDYPAAKLFPGVDLPEGLNTLGDIKRALQNAGKGTPEAKPKKKKPQKQPEPQGEDSEEGLTPTEKPEEESESKSDEPSEEESKPTTPQVKRRPVTAAERLEAVSLITDTFPPEDAAKVLAQEDLHPDDIKVLVRDYVSAKEGRRLGTLSSFVDKVSGFYSDDFGAVKPPSKGRDAKGDLVPFEKLSAEEQAEATLENQLQVMALSLAARSMVKSRLMDVGALSGKPRIPDDVASKITDAMFRPASEELGTTSFDEFLKEGVEHKISEVTAKNLLEKVGGNEGGSLVAKAFLQANDYANAKARFLRGDDESISEWQEPRDIVKGLGRVGKFFEERNAWYGGGPEHPAAGFFRMNVLKRLKALDPKKASAVIEELPALEQEEYEGKRQAWVKAHDAWAVKKSKSKNFSEPEPIEPMPPVRRPDKEAGRQLWKRVLSEFRRISKNSSDFTYSSGHVMDTKTAVYNGVDPYSYGPAEYTKWVQPHQRDIDSKAEQRILDAAAEWLSSPLLSASVEGMVPDARYRAALDLAITAGPYNGQIQPTLYNSLLARLAGVADPSKGKDTLLTIREASASYELSTQEWVIGGSRVAQEALVKMLEGIPLSYKDVEGTTHTNGYATLRNFQASGDAIVLEFPKGTGVELYRALVAALTPTGTTIRPKMASTSSDVAAQIQKFASKVADDRVAIEMAAYAQSLPVDVSPEVKVASDKFAKLKSDIVKYAFGLDSSKRAPVLPILKLLKDLG